MKQFTIDSQDGFDSLKFDDQAPMPKIGDNDVLVKIEGVSLNYRDLIIARGEYPFPVVTPVVPGSDGAGIVERVGSQVTRFKPGDKVITLFNQGHLFGDLESHTKGLGGSINGVMREYGTFNEEGLVLAPKSLSSLEASTLSCAGLTAWNALYGLRDRAVKAGDVVVVQGTGGVSLFGLQFAKASGAMVIATTSSEEKAAKLKELGADHVLNYKTNPKWGDEAKKLTGGRGADFVIEVAGPTSMRQSINAVKMGGTIIIIGFVGGVDANDQPSFLECLTGVFTARGVLVGSREQLEDLCRAVDANTEKLRPVLDQKIWSLDKAKEAYQYMWDAKHFGKVCLQL